MLPSGSTRPDQPIWKVSYVPASAFESDVTKSVVSITRWMPTASSSACMNCAWRAAAVPTGTIRCTVGFEIPEAATSFFACVGLYGVHLTVLSNHELDGERGVQFGTTVLLNTTFAIALRSIAISKASRRSLFDAIDEPTFEYGSFSRPFLFPRFSVMPW